MCSRETNTNTQYDSEEGWNWANEHDGVNDPVDDDNYKPYDENVCGDNCTDFVSYSLKAYGLPFSDIWDPSLGCGSAWAVTDDLYDYLTDEDQLGFEHITIDIVVPGGVMMSSEEIERWFATHEIHPSSIAFYNINNADKTYSHAAVVGPGDIYYNGVKNSPEITDMNAKENKPRSVLDTQTYNDNVQGLSTGNIRPYSITFVVLPLN